MPKSNRKIIMEQSLYDLLQMMNNNLRAGHKMNTKPCIMSAFEKEYVWERDARCVKHGNNCGKCLQEWLNEYQF